MKLASLQAGRDGRLLVVSDDLGWCVSGGEIAPSLSAALADWGRCAPLLRRVAEVLNQGAPGRRRFEPAACAAPLPQGWSALGAPLDLAAPHAPIRLDGAAQTRMAPGGVAVILGETPQGASLAQAAAAVRLVMIQGEGCSPVAVSPDSLGEAWRCGQLHGVLSVELNGYPIGRAQALDLDFAARIVQASRLRPLPAGTVISLEAGAPRPLRLEPGDRLRLAMRDGLSRSIFGLVDQVFEGEAAPRPLAVA